MHETSIDWTAGTWTHDPVSATVTDDGLTVVAAEGSDAWRHTSYGFVHDTEHALLAPLAVGRAVEVAFIAAFAEQFDQAGVFLRIDDETWIKAGVEYADGQPQVGAVVTLGRSDWSVAPVPDWAGRLITVRLSRARESVTVRARVDDKPWRLVRVAPLPENAKAEAGPFVCAPTRSGLEITFASWAETPTDASLHE
ncbi:hypothetical protein SAMN04489806_1276 [Paramicrobacterium humi]|uniref:DUF1349 domain-containing protein n=1 Tax=Paramicrobacterium humi TaxID=640635 RepID=A0A1H4KRI7_9MICO|nr:DUF1349 domain-containing protein [Microbacterium humi]SEB61013.1 hypothetical protein SAMN04489806_1276 [Microbacterium humi]